MSDLVEMLQLAVLRTIHAFGLGIGQTIILFCFLHWDGWGLSDGETPEFPPTIS
jgi:hypothetical protein